MQQLLAALEKGLAESNAEAQRLFHGRGHCYEGLHFVNVDWLAPVLLVTLYEAVEPEWLAALQVNTQSLAGVEGVLVQHRYRQGAPAEVLWGAVPEQLEVSEQGLRYGLTLGRSQNSGLFLDMANGRRWVREQAAGRSVLNLFSYTCAFSLAAMAGGARQVVNLDMSRAALTRGRENHRLNQHDLRSVQFLPHDLFRSWGRVRRLGPYELIIIDPPSFQKGSFVASKDYQRVLRRLPELMNDGAQVLVCLNDPQLESGFLKALVAEHAPALVFEARIDNPPEFAEKYPERGLKVLHYRYQAASAVSTE